MSFTAEVENDMIKLPPGVHLPNGTRVTVVPPENTGALPLRAKSPALASLLRHAGTVETLPEDFADRHDDYVRGRLAR